MRCRSDLSQVQDPNRLSASDFDRSAMTETETPGKLRAYDLAGEGMPKWLILGFSLVGLLTAVAAAWVFLSDQPASLEPPSSQIAVPKDGSAPAFVPPAVKSAESLHASGKPASTAAAEKDGRGTSVQPAPGATAVADGKRVDAPADQATGAQATSPAVIVDCPERVTILFDSSSVSPLGDDLAGRLRPLRTWLLAYPDARLLIEGHADSTGPEKGNLILSYRRAKGLSDSLRRWGVPSEQLIVRAAGHLQPVAGLPEDAAPNRRVTLQSDGSKNCRVSSTGSEPR